MKLYSIFLLLAILLYPTDSNSMKEEAISVRGISHITRSPITINFADLDKNTFLSVGTDLVRFGFITIKDFYEHKNNNSNPTINTTVAKLAQLPKKTLSLLGNPIGYTDLYILKKERKKSLEEIKSLNVKNHKQSFETINRTIHNGLLDINEIISLIVQKNTLHECFPILKKIICTFGQSYNLTASYINIILNNIINLPDCVGNISNFHTKEYKTAMGELFSDSMQSLLVYFKFIATVNAPELEHQAIIRLKFFDLGSNSTHTFIPLKINTLISLLNTEDNGSIEIVQTKEIISCSGCKTSLKVQDEFVVPLYGTNCCKRIFADKDHTSCIASYLRKPENTIAECCTTRLNQYKLIRIAIQPIKNLNLPEPPQPMQAYRKPQSDKLLQKFDFSNAEKLFGICKQHIENDTLETNALIVRMLENMLIQFDRRMSCLKETEREDETTKFTLISNCLETIKHIIKKFGNNIDLSIIFKKVVKINVSILNTLKKTNVSNTEINTYLDDILIPLLIQLRTNGAKPASINSFHKWQTVSPVPSSPITLQSLISQNSTSYSEDIMFTIAFDEDVTLEVISVEKNKESSEESDDESKENSCCICFEAGDHDTSIHQGLTRFLSGPECACKIILCNNCSERIDKCPSCRKPFTLNWEPKIKKIILNQK